MRCLVCNERDAVMHPFYGVLPCAVCQKRGSLPRRHEITTESIKQQRQEFADDLLQPFRGGVLSKEYLKKYGTKGIRVDQTDIQRAQNVWNDDTYYKGE